MTAIHRQLQIVHLTRWGCRAIRNRHVKPGTSRSDIDIQRPHVSLRGQAVGDDLPVRDPGNHGLHFRVIHTERGKSVERNVRNETVECPLQGVKIPVMIEMFRIDIGDNSNRRRQFQERTVTFIRLGHHPFTFTNPGIGAIGVDDAAVDNRWVKFCRIQHRRHQ